MTIKQLAWIRTIPFLGGRLHDAFKSIQNGMTAFEQQANLSATTQPKAPPALNGFKVTPGPGGEFQISISDNGQISRGIHYWAEHDTTPAFANPHIIDIGQTRNHSVYLGSQTLYWRGYSSYASSPPSAPVYHGSAAVPLPVTGGTPGARSASQGSGTGAPGQGLSGPGPVPARTGNSGFNWTAQQRK